MTINSRLIPENTNLLQTNKFTFIIPNLPFVSYQCQSVSFPGVSTSEVLVETPLSATYRHGDKLQFDPLVLTFMVDEDMRNWEEAFNWIKGLTFPTSGREYTEQKKKGLYHDGTLTINKNSNIRNMRFYFTACHPTSLGPINFSTSDDANMVALADLTLRYDTFRIERNS